MVGGLGLGVCINSVNAISEKAATIGAIGGGVVGGLITGGATYALMPQAIEPTAFKNSVPPLIVGLGTAVVSWWLLDRWLSMLTPKGRLSAATKIIRWIETDSFMMREFTSSEELVSYINIRFGTSWPLVFAREHLMQLTEGIEEVLHLLRLIHQDVEGDCLWEITTKCKELEVRVQTLTHALEVRMNLVFCHKDYQFQVRLYEKHQEAERQREHEIALRTGEYLHEGYERASDRRLEREEKEKDRRLKRQVLDIARANNGPLMISI